MAELLNVVELKSIGLQAHRCMDLRTENLAFTAVHYMDRADALEKRVKELEALVKRAAESASPWDILYHEMAKMPDLGPDGPDAAPTPEEGREHGSE